MCGLARCGKSSWIKKHNKSDIIVSPDRIRKLIFGHQFHKDAEDFVWAYAKGMAKLILEQGKNVLIDATNLNFYAREQWYKIAKDYKAKIKVIWIKTSLKECKKRNAKSPDGERLPEGTLDKMAYMFENPTREFADQTYGVEIVEVPYKGKHGDAGNIYQTEMIKGKIKKYLSNRND